MQVTVGIRRAIIINDDVNTFNINSAAENIRSNKNTFLECLECRISVDSKPEYKSLVDFSADVKI